MRPRSGAEADQEAARSKQVNDTVNKILDALRSNGYESALRIEDVKIIGGGPFSDGIPAEPTDADTRAEDPDRQA